MTVYAPGTQEKDLTKLNMSLQQNASANTTNATNIAANTASIATNTANIATNTAAIAAIGHPITASLVADVALNNTANYFDGPSIAQGTSGTWFVSGYVTLLDTVGACSFFAKLWDGTTVIASGYTTTSGANFGSMLPLSGYIASPAANLRISVRDPSTTTGKILFNTSGNSKDSTISAIRIA